MRLEIDSIKTNNEKLALEIEQLKKEGERNDRAESVDILTKRILAYVKKESTNQFGERKVLALKAQDVSQALNEKLEEVENALSVLKAHGAVKYNLTNDMWIFS
jgi:hypothetical protein